MTHTERKDARWKAVILYRTDNGLIEKTHYMEEMYDLHDIVEQGAHWDCVDEIIVTRYNPCFVGLTLEEAEKL